MNDTLSTGSKSKEQSGSVTFSVDSISKSLALVVALVYVCGYLILSLYDTRYGFVEMNPMRPRIFAAGLWFLFLVAFPLAVTVELLATNHWLRADPTWKKLPRIALAYCACCSAVFVLSDFIFKFDADPSKPVFGRIWAWVLAGILGVSFISFTVPPFKGIKGAIQTISMYVFIVILLITDLLQFLLLHRFSSGAITLWMAITGIIIFYFARRSLWKYSLIVASHCFVLFLAGLWLFAVYYYPNIKSSLGGGMPVPITVSFTKDSPVFASQSVSCLLLDETDSGFYLRGPSDRHATFVPRASVSLIRYTDTVEQSLFSARGK